MLLLWAKREDWRYFRKKKKEVRLLVELPPNGKDLENRSGA